MIKPAERLLKLLKPYTHIYIQTHNFPDHDAVASAFGLSGLLESAGLKTTLVFDGDIQRDSLKEMISGLGIDIHHSSGFTMTHDDKIVIVDGCKGSKNVTDLPGDELAVIDHHEVSRPEDVPFCDIRSGYGACSSIIFEYYQDLNLDIPQNIASALLIGLDMDTALLTRSVSEHDLTAYSTLYVKSNIRLVNTLLRNFIQVKDLDFYRVAIEKVQISDGFAYCYLPEGCNQNLMGILGDFFLSLKEVDFVMLAAANNGKINFSLRNERNNLNCSDLIQTLLKGIGFGGGHSDMAGGMIPDASLFNPDQIYTKTIQILNGKSAV